MTLPGISSPVKSWEDFSAPGFHPLTDPLLGSCWNHIRPLHRPAIGNFYQIFQDISTFGREDGWFSVTGVQIAPLAIWAGSGQVEPHWPPSFPLPGNSITRDF